MYIRTGVGALDLLAGRRRILPRSKPDERQLRADAQRAAGKSPDAATRAIYDANPWPVKCPKGQTANEKGYCVDESGVKRVSDERVSDERQPVERRIVSAEDKYDPASKVDDTPEAEAKYKMKKLGSSLFSSPLFLIALAAGAFFLLRRR